MARRIVLVRHGPSAHVHDGRLVDHDGMQRWREAYDSVGISADQPPAGLVRIANEATHIIASDLRRAVTSAEMLAPNRPIQVSDLLREIPLAIPRWPTRLPLGLWSMLVYLSWSYRIARGNDATDADLARAMAAAQWLEALVVDGSTALVVTHGVFRRVLAKQLLVRGWRSTERRGGYDNWSAWSFSGLPSSASMRPAPRVG